MSDVSVPAHMRLQLPRVAEQVSALLLRGDYHEACVLSDKALAQGLDHPLFHKSKGMLFESQGRLDLALEEYRGALAHAPRDFALLNVIGMCLCQLGRHAEAVEYFDAAIHLNAVSAMARFRKGWAQEMSGQLEEARKTYQSAIKHEPNHLMSLAGLASISARLGDNENAYGYAQRALALSPDDPTASIALGMVEINRGNFEAAETALRKIADNERLDLNTRTVALGVLGDALDGQKRAADAFAAYTQRNDNLLVLHAAKFENGPKVSVTASLIAHALRDLEWPAPQSLPAAPQGPKEHVFVLGFLRSGTTLLEQILASHPDVLALEERELLAAAGETYLTTAEGLRQLVTLEAPEIERLRADYWHEIEHHHHVDVRGKVFVDKMPLNTLKLPLIARLFPEAKIIFAVRDPRDVLLSCFRRHFQPNAVVYEMLTLDGAARVYDSVMRLGDLCREKLPLQVFEYRYEALVDDFEPYMRTLCAFMGIAWDESMRAFNEKERVANVRSPSAQQIRRSLNRDSIAHWRAYARELEAVRPVLAPWAQRFGYPAN